MVVINCTLQDDHMINW